ncbi:META domain-containing protein [uncultured Brachyspira sp.]|uniref:META domain-containing protein n=1 Tax=uncultured Brachyspira sp. TaxID=221953 RepID=UPI00261C0C37|nr:META domain-containing protein [uncultured Brachyspira sp.]
MKYIVGFLTIALFIISCSTTKISHNEKVSDNNLEGRKFKLISMYPDMNITIEFSSDSISGFSAVNNYSSSYMIDGDIFSVLSITATKKFGSKEENTAENEYLNMLKSATSYKITGKNLIIYTLLSDKNLIFEEI